MAKICKIISEKIKNHPLIAFITLAYLISWFSWFLVSRTDFGNINGFGIIAAAGPSLAGVIVSALLNPERSKFSPGKRWGLFIVVLIVVLTVVICRRLWIVSGLISITGRTVSTIVYPTLTAFIMDLLASIVVAIILSAVFSSRRGVVELFRSINLRDNAVRWYWWVIALCLYPAVIAVGNAISAGFGIPEPAPRATGPWYFLVVEVLTMFLVVMIGGGGLEEPGWRGFALPILQKRFGPIPSSLILAVIWAFWHWPLFWLGYSEGGPLGGIFYMFGVAPIAFLFTAVFNYTRGNLPIVILLHTSINITPIFFPASTLGTSLWMLLILSLVFWMWRFPQTFSFLRNTQ